LTLSNKKKEKENRKRSKTDVIPSTEARALSDQNSIFAFLFVYEIKIIIKIIKIIIKIIIIYDRIIMRLY